MHALQVRLLEVGQSKLRMQRLLSSLLSPQSESPDLLPFNLGAYARARRLLEDTSIVSTADIYVGSTPYYIEHLLSSTSQILWGLDRKSPEVLNA